MAGGVPTHDGDAIDPMTTLVGVSRANSLHYFPVELVQLDVAGKILLQADDVVSVKPWYKTELNRGIKKTTDAAPVRVLPTPAPPTRFDSASLLVWFQATRKGRHLPELEPVTVKLISDRARMGKFADVAESFISVSTDLKLNQADLTTKTENFLGDTPNAVKFADWSKTIFVPAIIDAVANTGLDTHSEKKGRWVHDVDFLSSLYAGLENPIVPFTYHDERGIVQLPEAFTQVAMQSKPPYHPNLFALQTGTGSTSGAETVMVLRRHFSDRMVEFTLLRKLGRKAQEESAIAEMLWSSLVFAGDEVEVKPLVQTPIMLSSLLAPLIHQQRLVELRQRRPASGILNLPALLRLDGNLLRCKHSTD